MGEEVNAVLETAEKLINNIKLVIRGKDDTIEKIVVCLLLGGHVLLEDVPGSGKTTLAKALAASINGDFKRIQMTPDLLPADITGVNIFDLKTSEFKFVKGPVFTNILIADEINRATPKTQSGLLECMEENQVTVDGVTYKLEKPFMVIATENPVDTQGVFPLPEAQIDRFLMKLYMEYPSHDSMLEIFRTHLKKGVLESLKPAVTLTEIIRAAEIIEEVTIEDSIIEYATNLIEATRTHDSVILGVSQRGGIALLRAAKCIAALRGRNYVKPDDVKYIAGDVLAHRMILKNNIRIKKSGAKDFIADILEKTAVPTEETIG
ncbi:MAG: MoxR family ATPase [Lachnospiraceae bacterium]|jgi:MoxR-like ATPases|nr:MoxR family ATPase [Lachnospiraceae bacterium]